MKPDEWRFLIDCADRVGPAGSSTPFSRRCTPRDIINTPGFYIHHKRAWYILEKWACKGWYEYGVNVDLGWMTGTGMARARQPIPANVAHSMPSWTELPQS